MILVYIVYCLSGIRIISKSREPLKIKGSRDFLFLRDVNVMFKSLFYTYSIYFFVLWNGIFDDEFIKIFYASLRQLT